MRERLLRRVLVSAALALIAGVALSFAGQPTWFVVTVAVALVSGYSLIDVLMERKGAAADVPSESTRFLLIAIVAGLGWSVLLLAFGYFFSK